MRFFFRIIKKILKDLKDIHVVAYNKTKDKLLLAAKQDEQVSNAVLPYRVFLQQKINSFFYKRLI